MWLPPKGREGRRLAEERRRSRENAYLDCQIFAEEFKVDWVAPKDGFVNIAATKLPKKKRERKPGKPRVFRGRVDLMAELEDL